MKGIPEDRALMLGQYIVDHGATVRSTAATHISQRTWSSYHVPEFWNEGR